MSKQKVSKSGHVNETSCLALTHDGPCDCSEPQFKVGDRVFTHYDMRWGTVKKIDTTYRGQTHGVTGTPLPDTTWYEVQYDDGGRALLDDAHGNWDMARIVPPRIAERYGYGKDPKAS